MTSAAATRGLTPPFSDVRAQDSICYRDEQESARVKPARLLPYTIAIGCCFDSHRRIVSILQKLLYRQ